MATDDALQQMDEAITQTDFSGSAIMKEVTENMKSQRLPSPARPKADDPEYQFPEDPDELTSAQLGQLMLRFAAWEGYTHRLLGPVEAELVALEKESQIKVLGAGAGLRDELGKNAGRDTVEAAVLAFHPEFLPLTQRITKLKTAKASLESRATIYQAGWSALSREQTRRADERQR